MNRTLVVACMAVALAGSGSSGPALDDAFYRLQAVSGTPEMAVPLDGTVLVSGIASRGFTGGRNIVFWDAARPEITQRYTYHFWVEPPAVLIHDVIVQAFRDARLAKAVVTATQRARTDYVVSGTLLRMEHRRFNGPH